MESYSGYCMICLDIALMPVECEICRERFCLRCANKWTIESQVCPKKCSANWFYRRIDADDIKLKCHYSEHEGAMFNPNTLEMHMSHCPYRPEELKKQDILRDQNLCNEGHQLSLYKDSYSNMVKGKCVQCHKVQNCRSKCVTCNQIYCIFCRNVKFGPQICPTSQHPVEKVDHKGLLCDQCGLKPHYMRKLGYIDYKCDLALCEDCFVGICGAMKIQTKVKLQEEESKKEKMKKQFEQLDLLLQDHFSFDSM